MDTVYLIGPREPSGLSWLYNCFLCLGIKVHTVGARNGGHMWQLDGDRYVLNPVDDIQKKWAPVLSTKSHFDFRDDFEVQFGHTWPTGWQRGQKIIFFVRNPYDALLSRWRREANKVSFGDYLKVPDHTTLLDKVDNWNLFCEAWLKQKSRVDWHVVKFEDYRTNAEEALREVTKFLDIEFSDEEIANALSQSGFEVAKQAEDQYQPSTPSWLEVCDDVFQAYNRRKANGGPASQSNLDQTLQERNFILNRTANVCRDLGYPVSGTSLVAPSYLPQKAMLSFYRHLDIDEEWLNDVATFNMIDYLDDINALFINIRDVNTLFRSSADAWLYFGEVAALIAALQEMQGNYLSHFKNKENPTAKTVSSPSDTGFFFTLRKRFFRAVKRTLKGVS